MSFADIESGLNQRASPLSSLTQSRDDIEFNRRQHALSIQILKINGNVQGILKLVDKIGTPADTPALRKNLHDLAESTKEMVKKGGEDLTHQVGLGEKNPQYKAILTRTKHDFQLSLTAFRRAQQVSAERLKTAVETMKVAREEDAGFESTSTPPPQQQRQLQQQKQLISAHELAYQDNLIREREEEIREIETGIVELSEIFRDLSHLVNEQGELVDNIESNISSIAVDVAAGSDELTTAHEYQRKAGRRAACLMIVLVIVVCVVLLAVLS